MKNILHLLILFLLVSACTEIIDLELNEGDNEKLVVDAWLTNEVGSSKVQLSLSTSYFQNEAAPAVSDAEVTVMEGTQTIPFIHSKDGLYLPTTDFKGSIGQTYQLEIKYKEKLYTSSATINRILPIDAIEYEYDEEAEDYDILFYGQEPAGVGDFYLFKIYENGTLMADTLQNTDFVDDEFVDGNYIDGATIGYGDFEIGDSVRVEVWSISEAAYDFFIAVSLETAWRGGIFDTPPANIPTNIEGGALGFFNASAIERQVIVIEE